MTVLLNPFRFTTAGGGTWVDEVSADSPVRWWRMEDASGDLTDEQGNQNLTPTGTVTYEQAGQGNAGNAVEFASSAYAAASGVGVGMAAAFTLEIIFMRAGFSGSFRWLSADSGFTGWRTNSSDLLYYVRGTSVHTATHTAGAFHHCIITGTAGIGGRCYLDGTQIATFGTFSQSGTNLTINGKDGVAGGIASTFDEVAFYTAELSDERCLAHAAALGF